MGPSHRLAGVASWLAYADVTHTVGLPLVGGVVVAAASSHGRPSPDSDLYPPLKGRVAHRGITHLWAWPVLLYLAALLYLATLSSGLWWWAPVAVAVGWASHIVTDGVFGRGKGRPRWFILGNGGVPVWRRRGRWVYWGLRFKTGGPFEYGVAVPVFIVACGWLGWHALAPSTAPSWGDITAAMQSR